MANEFGSQDPFGLFGKSSKPQPAKQPATDPLESYIASAKAAESGGNPRAKNPNSSATGLYQFTGPTWAGLMQAHPELNLSADGRTDPAQQERAMRAFTADNAAVLKSKGIPVDGGSLYAAHFLGAGGASQVLTAPDNTPLSAVVDRKAMASNGFLSGMTVGDFKKWAAAKGSGGPAPISTAAPAPSVQVDAGFKPSDPMGLYRGAQFSPEPQTTPAPAPADGPSPEQQRVQQLYQQLEQAQPGRYQLIYADQAQQTAADWQKANGSDGLLGDTWRLLGMGQVGLEASTRELVNQIPVIGPHLVAAGDQIDKWVYGKPSAERYADLYNRDAATLTPETQAARDRQWWDDKNGRLGDAWLDPRAYFSGAVESLPSMVATMAPGMWLAKGAFAGAIARGLSTEAASAAAARTALFSGAVLEGSLGGADAARATRAQIEAMPRDQLLQSDAVRALVSQGLSPDEAIKAIANDAATQAFIIGGIGTGIFGGFGDRALAKIIAEGVGGSLAKRIVSGALREAFAEGVLEEAPQSALSQLGQNIAMRNVDPTQDLGAGVLDQTLGGAAIGGVMGAAMGGAGGAFRQADEPSLAEPVQRPLPDSAMESAPQPTTAPATPSRGPLAEALAQGLAAAQTPSVDLSGEDLTPKPGETRVDAPGPDMPTMPAAYVGYPEPGKRVIVDEPTLGRFAARVEQYVDDPESGQLEAVVVDDSGEVMQVPATTLQVASLTKELMAKMDVADQPPVAQGPPVDAADEAKARVVNGKTLVMPDETLAKLYDLGTLRRQQKVLTGASALQMRDVWNADSQALADALGVLPERINEIADDYRYRVERVSKTAPDNRSSLMHGLNTQKLKAWRAERAAKPALDAATADVPVQQTDAPAPKADEITAAANAAATSPTNDLPEPTQAQKEAGNYKLGHVKLGGLDISIENPAGSERKGVDKGGKAWSVKMKAHYGYIKGTVGKDKDHVDVFIRKDAGDIADADPVFVIDQVNAEGGFDEHKVMLGYKEAAQAKRGYLANYTKGWTGLGAITQTTLGEFKQWLASGNTAKPFGKIAESAKAPQPVQAATEAAPAPEKATAKQPEKSSAVAAPPDRLTQDAVNKVLRSKEWKSVFGSTTNVNAKTRHYAHPESPVAYERVQGWLDAKAGLPPQQEPAPWHGGPTYQQNAIVPYLEGYIGGRWGDAFEVRESDALSTYRSIVAGTFDKQPDGSPDEPDVDPVDELAAKPQTSTATSAPKGRKPDAAAAARELLGNWTAGPIQSVGIGKDLQGGTVFDVAEIGPNGTVTLQARGALPLKLTLKELRAEVAAGLSFTAVAPAPAPQADAQNDRFAKNKLFTADKVEAARARLRGKMGQLNSGIDPEVLIDGMTIAGAYIEAGVRNFADYAKAMVGDFGDGIAPYLLSFWEGARNYPGLDTEGMTNHVDSAAAFAAMIAANAEKADEPRKLDQRSQGALEGAPADEVSVAPEGGDAEAGAAGRGGADVSRGEPARGERVPAGRGVADGAGTVSDPAGRGQQPGAGAAKSDARGAGSSGTRSADDDDRVAAAAVDSAATPAQALPNDFTIMDEDAIGAGGAKTKFRANVAAIKLLRELDAANRPATRQEQAVLAKWVGWGGLSAAFPREDGSLPKGWDKEAAELKELLTPEEYRAAEASTRNAHYTSPEVVRAIWSIVQRAGFAGGRVLEPSVGAGNFLGLIPADLRDSVQVTGVELDRITGGVAKHLYPKAKIHTPVGFQDVQIPDGYFDLAIGNPPFGSEKLYDPIRRDISKFSIHNFFFAKSLDALRPGGLLAMVVSNGLMDAVATDARRYIAARADLVGAIRLPNDAFLKNAGTEVTTDILVFQRRDGVDDTASPDWVAGPAQLAWKDAKGKEVALNPYFQRRPEMMLGDFGAYGTMYRANSAALVARPGQNLADELERAIGRLPAGIVKTGADPAPETITVANGVDSAIVGSMFISDGGAVHVRRPDVMMQRVSKPVEFPNDRAKERVTGMIRVRDAFARLRHAQINPAATDDAVERLRARLNKIYDTFVAANGPINQDANKRLFRDDPTWPQIAALEDGFDKGLSEALAKKTGETPRAPSARKAKIFTLRTQQPYSPPTSAATAKDALAAVLSERGRVDIDAMAALYGKSPEETIAELGGLIFRSPGGAYETADAYLSGNVKKKLALAREAAQKDRAFERNVSALEGVIPADVEAVDIDVKPGVGWVPAKYVGQFIEHLTEGRGAKAVYSVGTAQWIIDPPQHTAAAEAQWATERVSLKGVIEAVLAGRAIQVFDQLGEGKLALNQAATDAANEKAARVAAEWRRWLWQDDERRETLSRLYNDTFNTDAPRAYDGMHLQLPGKVGDDIIELRPHQKSFIWRAMQTSTALADHAVGAGKTFALIATAMEFRRTGLAKKPMFVVPNHLVGQWAADFVKLYPGARVLAATKADFEKGKRQELFSRVATGDWDAVIVSHSSFGKVPVDPEFETRFINQQIADLEQSVRELQSEGEGRSRTVKQLAKQREALETRFKKLMDSGRKDLGMTFEEMGVDALFVDEAHEFKNLGFATRMTRIAGLGNSQGSAKAADLYTKVQSVLERTGGRNIVFATGTPISNTMAELFTVQRYLDYPALKAAGIAHFDAWARVFGEVVTDWELSPSGTYKLTSRFAKFVNMPELMQRYRAFADVITNDDIKRQLAAQGKTLPLPKVKDGKPSIVVVERNAAQARFIGEPALDERGNEQYPKGTLVWRAENLPKKQEPGADNMLKVMSDARKAALDMRLIDPGLPDFRGSKVHVAADNIKRIYKRWNADKGTQLVFIDLSTPKAARGKEAERIADLLKKAEEGDEDAAEALEKLSPDELLAVESSFSVYDDLKQKLIDRGIPSDEIAFIHDANTDAQKEELFGKVRTGRVRVLFGSTPKMGAGTNVQNRLVALHHLDAPWRPSDLEQRDGRGIRQGNELYEADPEGFELEILRYATKNTLDARQWQTIEGKARFIAQVRKGGTEREVEDVAGEAANAAEMKAAASGNPLVLEEMDLRRKLRKLDGARSEHEREQFRIRGTMSRLRAGIDKAAAMLSSLEKDAASAGAIIDAGFPHTVAGQTIEKATQLGDLVIAKAKEAFLAGAELPFGKFGDFALSAQPVPRVGAEQAVRITMTGAMDHSFTLETPVDANATGVGTVMLNVLRSLRKEPERVRGNIEADTAQLPKLEAQVQPWSGARELEDTKAAHATVLAKLKPKPSANTAAPSGAQPSANPDAVISLTGSELGIAFNGASDMPALRSAAKTWYDQHLRNTTATMADGTVVRFSRKGMGKSTSDAKGDLLLRSVPAIRAIIEGGRVVLREPGSRPGIVERIVIAAPVDFAGRRLNLAVSVHRSANGDVHYDLNMDRDAKDGTPGVSPGGAAPDGALPSLEMPRPAEINLMQWSELNNAPVGWDEVSAGGPVALSQEDRAALAEIVRTVAGLSEVQWHDRISLPNGAPGWGKNTPTTAAGYYDPVRDLIGLADDTASDRTAFHEAFHRLQNLFLSDEERATLRADLPKLRRIVKANEFRSEQAGAMSPKEVEAEAFALYATGLAKAKPHTLVRAAWERIIAAVRRVINWAGGRGFQISEDVFERAMRGEVAARDAGGVSTLLRAYAVNPDAPYVVKPSTVDQQLPRREGPRLGRPARVTQETIVRQIKGKLVDLQPALLKVIPLNYFTELAQPNMSAVQSYLGIKRQMDAYRGRKHAAADEIAQEWLKFSRLGWGLLPSKDGKAASARLSSLMHDSTLAGIDPSSTLDEHRLKPGYDDLRRRYLELPPTGRELFTKVRDAYVAQADELDKLLLDAVYKAQKIARNKAQERYEAEIDRINSSDLEGEALRKAVEDASAAHARDMLRSQYAAKGRLSQMRRQFEQSRVPAPYFPLMRYGRYFVSVKNARGEVVSFSRREKAADRDALAKQMRSEMPQGFKVEVGVLDGSAAGLREYMDPRLLADIEAILGGAGVDGKVMDAIYQRYLETMPDLSARKRFIHRKGTRGYDEDALRAFSSHMFHAAHQMGRIKYGLDLQEMTDQATIQARTAPDPTAGMTLANQLKQHHQWVMNPTGSAVAQVMTSAAFTWYLAGSPAAALVNLTQTPMLGIPILGARFGTAKSADALLKASADVVRGKGDIAAKLNAEERAVMERFYESGLIDRTQAHDLAGVGETGVNYSPLRARVMGVMSWAFHKAEVVNRQVTALAAYRLARAAGRTAEEAVNLAHDLTWKVHFDYSNASRPAVLQNDIAKVALVFRNHTINMLYRMFRDMHQAVKGATPQARKEARYQLAAVIGMQALVGGLKGVFAFNLLMALAGLAFGNDDDPLDFKAQMEKHVMDALGPELGGILLNGAPGHYLKVDLTDRVGMPDLWWRSPPQDLQGRDEFQYYVMSSLGASVSLLGDLKFAVDLAAEGNVGRALEVAAPKWAKDLLKSARYMGSGVTTLNGDTLLERTEIDPWTGIAQALGFTPAKIAETYERNNALKNAEQRVLDERRELINRYVTAILQDDEGAAKATAARISTFNGSGYGRTIPITSDTIRRSMKTRRSNDEKRVDGVLISNEKLGATLRAAMAPAVYR